MTPADLWLHRYAVFLAGYTLFLVLAGASVTSTGSGLAVPDWPLSYGTLFPPMVGGIIFEHGHRMIAGVLVLLTVVLVVWIFRRDDRAWVRRLGIVALLALVVQALLGGMTVLLKLPTQVSVSHAALAQAFFCIIVSIALFTSPGWRGAGGGGGASNEGGALRKLAVVTTGVIYLQILVGAVMRHMGAGLAIPDFPLAHGGLWPPYFTPAIAVHYAHRVGAFVVLALIVALVTRVLRSHRSEPRLATPTLWLGGLLIIQLLLGAITIWSRRAVIPTTAHVAMGAAVLAVSLLIALQSYRDVITGAMRREGVQ